MTDSRPADATPEPAALLEPLAEATLHVYGLGCRHCVDRVTRALRGVEGVVDAAMDYDARLATVTYHPTRVDPRAFLHAIILEGADRGQSFDADILTIRSLHPADTAAN